MKNNMLNNLDKKQNVVTRFAPSPTGVLHIGSVRTALFNYLYAKKHGGKLILRIEDTDKERSKKEHEDGLIASLAWLGLSHDEFYRQSERTDLYKEKLVELISNGAAYEGEESKGGEGKVIRFKNPNKKVTFQDEVVGEVTFDTTELGDFVIARDMNSPVYHFVIIVDDGAIGVTHVIRGQDHISNTPRQILILEALGYKNPVYAHLPLIMSPTGGKLSKRDPEVMSVMEYKEKGYLKESLLNFLAFIGWNPGDDKEILSVDEMIQEFSLDRVQKGGASFNSAKLKWINKQYINKMNFPELKEKVSEFITNDLFEKIKDSEKAIRMITERIEYFGELTEQENSGDFTYLTANPNYDAEKLIMKKSNKEEAVRHLKYIEATLEKIEVFDAVHVKDSLWEYATEEGRGNVLWPFRLSLSGKDRSPDPFDISEVIGKESTIDRVQTAIKMLQ